MAPDEGPQWLTDARGVRRYQDRTFVAWNEAVHLRVAVDPGQAFVVASASLFEVVRPDGRTGGLVRRGDVLFARDPPSGSAPSFSSTLAPGEHLRDPSDAAELVVVVSVVLDGVEHSIEFPLIYTRGAPARFTGDLAEELRDGSLQFLVELEVDVPGRYRVEAVVLDADGVAFAHLRRDSVLEAGPATVELELFGLLVRDVAARSPFQILELRGERMIERAFPDREQMPTVAVEFTTRTYAADEFSDREWDGVERRRHLGVLRGLAGGG